MARDQQKTQKNQQVPNLSEDEARDHVEKLRWPNGPYCPHCGSINAYRMQGESIRAGLLACRDCKGHFTVTVGTVMEDSHLPLSTWVRAFHFMASSKKGMSALQLQRNLGLGSYRTAWFLAHRIREAMKCEPVAGMLKGEVQVDETYMPPSRHEKKLRPGQAKKKTGRGTDRQPVMVLVETNGKARSLPIDRIDGKTLRAAMVECIDPAAMIVTDELRSYPKAAQGFAGHATVNHSIGQYVRPDGLHTNSAESFFALLKRGVHGTFHHVSKKHLHRYCAEFDFRWNGRKLEDCERRDLAVQGAEGKRLFYRLPVSPDSESSLQ